MFILGIEIGINEVNLAFVLNSLLFNIKDHRVLVEGLRAVVRRRRGLVRGHLKVGGREGRWTPVSTGRLLGLLQTAFCIFVIRSLETHNS